MPRLKDGTQVEDPRLGRLTEFDERSREYPATRLLMAPQVREPRSWTWNFVPRRRPTMNQGREGACVGYALTHELLQRPVVVTHHGGRELDDTFAREQVYWEAQRIDSWPGGSYPGASPRYEGTSILAGMKVISDLGFIEEYRWAFGLDDLIASVAWLGPAVIGIPWYEGMYTPDEDGFIHPTGKQVGGHAIVCASVQLRGDYFELPNSWGTGGAWSGGQTYRGRRLLPGWCRISFEEMGRLLDDGGEACIPVERGR